jgi:hypothetical protein
MIRHANLQQEEDDEYIGVVENPEDPTTGTNNEHIGTIEPPEDPPTKPADSQ